MMSSGDLLGHYQDAVKRLTERIEGLQVRYQLASNGRRIAEAKVKTLEERVKILESMAADFAERMENKGQVSWAAQMRNRVRYARGEKPE